MLWGQKKREICFWTTVTKNKNKNKKQKQKQAFHDSEIHRVVIFNRVDNFHERLHDLEVRIFNEDDEFKDPNNLCGRFEGVVPGPMAPGGDGGAVVIDCATPLKGGVVSVQIRRDDAILTVCEIQVFQVDSLSEV